MKAILRICTVFWVFSLSAQSSYLPFGEDRFILLNGQEKLKGLFDEGPMLLNSNLLPSQKPESRFHSSYQKLYTPQDYLLILDAEFRIDSFYFYDGAGRDSFEIYIGSPGAWQSLAKLYTDSYEKWRKVNCKGSGPLLLLRFKGPQAELGELLLYGEKISSAKQKIRSKKLRSPIRLKEFIGINAFVDDPIEKVASVSSLVREYHNWDWHYPAELSKQELKSPPAHFAPAIAGPWDFDQYYSNMQKAGLKLYPCLQGSPPWLQAQFDYKPIGPGLPADAPTSYALHSAFVYNFVARYGSQKHDLPSLSLAKGQPVRSGLNLIQGIETWNEPDKWWRDRKGYFHPFEYAALLSADYDGHAGALGPHFGAKQADPNLPVIMGGLAGLDTNYIEGIRLWAAYRRPKGDFPADYLNFHHYSNDAGGQDDRAHYGVPPEDDSLRQRLENIVAYRNRVLPQQKIFLSEFGYDSNPKSIQAPAPDDSLAVLEAQANFLVRSILLAHASGIDGAFIYMFRDVNAPNPNKYMSSGLTAEKWNQHRPKPAFYKMRSLMEILGEYVFEAQEQNYLKELYIYRYRHPETGARAYVMWTKSIGRRSSFRELYFLEESGDAEVYRLSEDNQSPSAQTLFGDGKPLEVNNSPVIVIFKR